MKYWIIIVLVSLLEYDYPNLENYYQQLKNLTNPTLILWGRQDRVLCHEDCNFKTRFDLFLVIYSWRGWLLFEIDTTCRKGDLWRLWSFSGDWQSGRNCRKYSKIFWSSLQQSRKTISCSWTGLNLFYILCLFY